MTLIEAKPNQPLTIDRKLTLSMADAARRPITTDNELEAVGMISDAVHRVQEVAEAVLSRGRWHEKTNPGGLSTPEYYISDLMTALDAYSGPEMQLTNGTRRVDYPAAQISLVRLMGRADYAHIEGARVIQKSRQPISDYTVHEIVTAQPALIPDLLGWIETAPEKVVRSSDRREASKLRISDVVVELMHAVMEDKELSYQYGMNVARICIKLASNASIVDERMGQLLDQSGRLIADRLSRVVHGSEGEVGLLQDVRKQRALMEPVADSFSGKISAKLDEIAKSASKAANTQKNDGESGGYVVQQKHKPDEQQAQEKTVSGIAVERMRTIVDTELGQIDLALIMAAQPSGLDEFQLLASWAQIVSSRFPNAEAAKLSVVVADLWREYEKLIQVKDNQLADVLHSAEASQDGSIRAYAGYMRGLLKMRTALKGLLLNKMQELDATRIRMETEKATKEKEAKVLAEKRKQEEADRKRWSVAVNVGLDDL